MYYIEINNGEITSKGIGCFVSDKQIEVNETIYNQLTYLPANFTQDEEGNIITVIIPPPEPIISEPTIIEMLLIAYQEIADLKERIGVLEGV